MVPFQSLGGLDYGWDALLGLGRLEAGHVSIPGGLRLRLELSCPTQSTDTAERFNPWAGQITVGTSSMNSSLSIFVSFQSLGGPDYGWNPTPASCRSSASSFNPWAGQITVGTTHRHTEHVIDTMFQSLGGPDYGWNVQVRHHGTAVRFVSIPGRARLRLELDDSEDPPSLRGGFNPWAGQITVGTPSSSKATTASPSCFNPWAGQITVGT